MTSITTLGFTPLTMLLEMNPAISPSTIHAENDMIASGTGIGRVLRLTVRRGAPFLNLDPSLGADEDAVGTLAHIAHEAESLAATVYATCSSTGIGSSISPLTSKRAKSSASTGWQNR